MADRAQEKLTRRCVLRAVAGTGLTVGVAGCLGTSSTSEGNTSENATTQPTASTAGTSETPTATTSSARQSTESAPPSTSDSGTAPSETPPTTAGGATERGEYTIGMYTELYFDPIGLYVEPGASVSFELVSGVHSAAAYHPDNEAAFGRRVPENAPAWDTGVFDDEGKFRTVTFETRGTHDYFCLPHKQLGMVGRIVVGEPGGPATKSPNPDGDLPDSEEIVEQESVSYEGFQASSQ